MKKFLALVLCIVMAFSLTACKGSEENGTKGSYTGKTFTATWEKAIFGDSIKLTVNSNNINNEEYVWTEELYDYENTTSDIPFSVEKELGTTSCKYTVTPITDQISEENPSITVPILIKCSRGDAKLDTAVELICNFTVSSDPVLSLSVSLVGEAAELESAGDEFAYDVRYGSDNDLDLMLLLAQGKKGDWSLISYDDKHFTVDGPERQADDKALFTVKGIKEGTGKVTLQNSGTGKSYEITCVSSAAEGEENIGLFKVEMTGIDEQIAKVKVQDVEGYETIKGKTVTKKDKNGKTVVVKEKPGIDVGFDVDDIIIPEDVVVDGAIALNEECTETGDSLVYMEIYVNEVRWVYTSATKLTCEELSAGYKDYYDSFITMFMEEGGMTKAEAQKALDANILNEKITINGKTATYKGAGDVGCYITWTTNGINYCLSNFESLSYDDQINVAKRFVQ